MLLKPPDITIEAGVLELRSWNTENAAELFSLIDSNRNHLSEWLPWVGFVKQVSDSENFIKDAQKGWDSGAKLELGIWYKGELAGCIGLHELNRLHNKTSLGYWLGSEFQGNGIMTRAVEALVQYCFDVQKFHRVELRAAVENTKSRAVAERLNFVQEGVLRQAELVGGRYLDVVVYSRIGE